MLSAPSLLAEDSPDGPALAFGARLKSLGAPTLARAYLESRQPDLGTRPGAWARWERARLEDLRETSMWRALVQRRESIPSTAPSAIRTLADELAAEAYLRLGDGDGARAVAETLLATAPVEGARREAWWRLLVEANLIADRPDEAGASLLGYRNEFPDDQPGWAPLEARLLLLDGHFEEVLLSLDGMRGTPIDLLRLAAVAGSGGGDPVRFRAAAASVLDSGEATSVERYQAWALVGSVAGRFGELEQRALAYESALAEIAKPPPSGLFAAVTPDQLWTAYIDLARRLGNEARLLVGRHDDWLALADGLAASDPLAARATLAFLALESVSREVREAAAARLASAAWDDPRLQPVVMALWLRAERIDSIDVIPDAMRPLIVMALVAEGRYEAADALAPERSSVPPATEPAPPWLARYGHSLVRAGAHREGAAVLVAAINHPDVGLQAWWGSLVGAVHELQSGEDQALALELIAAARGVTDAPHVAALALLAAETEAAAGRDRAAALAYLEASASMDEAAPERALARLLAARALLRAGLVDDAEGVMRELAKELPPGALAAMLAGDATP